MEEEGDCSSQWPQRWAHIGKLLDRSSPLVHPSFEPGLENLRLLHKSRVLVVGAGGLGCELLKNLALSGFRTIHVIDMDTIDLSNLNRQFLFRVADVGSYKAEVAARFVSARVPGCSVVPHNCKIQDMDEHFYRSFSMIICGLDSIVARRWLNGMIVGLLEYDDDGDVQTQSIIPLIDGGTEGFKGSARVILPGFTPCIECTINLYPPQVNFPLCTIAHTPRLPEHCVEYVKVIQWEKDAPFDGKALDGDDPEHVQWVFDKAEQRADQFGIKGITYRLTQGVLKRIIPAVASTNAVIAAACALEAFKLASNIALPMNNYMNFSDLEGIYVGVVAMEKRDDCIVCSRVPRHLHFAEESKLQLVIDHLTGSAEYQMKSPSIMAPGKTLYMANTAIKNLEELSRLNLRRSLKDLGLTDGDEIAVSDETLSQALTFRLHLLPPAMDT